MGAVSDHVDVYVYVWACVHAPSDFSSTAFGLLIVMKSLGCGWSLTNEPFGIVADLRWMMSPSLRCMFSIIQNGRYTMPS